MGNSGFQSPKAARGSSLVELAFILPVLLMLALGVIDFARAIQFNNILVAMSREGANLASRSSTTITPQQIIIALNNTANPLVMPTHGMIYITQIKGVTKSGNVYPQVQAQTKATAGDTSLLSQVWNHCGAWNNTTGSCTSIPAANNTATMPMTLSDGDIVYAVETLYNYQVIVNYVMKTGPKLYSLTLL